MKRRSYKYIFYFNVFVIVTLLVVINVIFKNPNNGRTDIPVSITTPLLHAENVNMSLCQNAKSAVLIDAKSGAVLFEKNAHSRRPMASTTKIMTALAVIENAPCDKIIKVSPGAQGIEGSSIYLKSGEEITVLDLLYGLLLESGNDAATALAIGVFGSEEGCVEYMNKRAHDMGLVDTSFENVHGLDGEKHYTTAYELALLSKHAMQNSLFREIVSTKNYTTKGENPRYFSNHNRLLYGFEGAVGIKTGYTSKAGRCLVSAAKFDNEEYIAVTLSDPLDWNDHKEMHTYGFENFDSIEIANAENFVIVSDFSMYVPAESVYVTISGKGDFVLDYKTEISGDTGKVEFYALGNRLGRFGITKKESDGG